MLKVENLSYTYNMGMPGQTKALDNINLEIQEGSVVGVIGHTGCGKSTLIGHFNGLTKPQEGRILLEGKDITGIFKLCKKLKTTKMEIQGFLPTAAIFFIF